MATYKVIQDIEAEDHILGPLTLRQFVFALIAIFLFYISFLFLTKGVGFLDVLFLPPGLFFSFFAIPFGRDQPTEIWALAKLRFFLKPRRRIWDQSGIKELVTITVPKKIERQLTDGLNQYEVESRLKVLANTLDSRGWAIKDSTINHTPQSLIFAATNVNDVSDRLVDINPLASVGATNDEVDVLDEVNSPLSHQLDQMIDQSSKAHRQELIDQMNAPAMPVNSPAGNNWFMPQVDQSMPSTIYAPEVPAQSVSPDEESLISRVKTRQQEQKSFSSNLRTLKPLSDNTASSNQSVMPSSDDNSSTSNSTNNTKLTEIPDPAIISLANSGDNLTVETIAHEANKKNKDDSLGQDEVVISLH